jgi:hypothetical protein
MEGKCFSLFYLCSLITSHLLLPHSEVMFVNPREKKIHIFESFGTTYKS